MDFSVSKKKNKKFIDFFDEKKCYINEVKKQSQEKIDSYDKKVYYEASKQDFC